MEYVKIIEAFAIMIGLFGIFCVGRCLSDIFFLPREIVTAVMILDDEARKNADILLHILNRGIWRMADRKVYVFISERYAGDGELIEMIVASGAEYRTIKEI